MDFLKSVYFGMMEWQWMVLVAGSILLMLAVEHALNRLVKRSESLVDRSRTDLDDFLVHLAKKVTDLTLLAVALRVMQFFLPVPASFSTWFHIFFFSAVYLQVGYWATPIYAYLFRKFATDESGNSRQTSLAMVVKILSWITYVVLAVMALDTLPGVDVTTLIATLGIGGIAIAFGLQRLLSDFTAALTIPFDQPFEVGDALLVDGIGGTVEKIGLKSTRLRSWDGQEIVISNSDLLSSRINNFKTLERRRVLMNFRVTYQTSADNLARIPELVEGIISNLEQATYARTHSTLLNSSSIDFECVYYVESADFTRYMEVRHQVNIALIRCFEEAGIKFAFPTQTIFVEKEMGQSSSSL